MSERCLLAQLVVRRDRFTLDIALTVEAGEVVALLGPNGAGKTTALRALAGLTSLDAGEVRLPASCWRARDLGAARAPADRRGLPGLPALPAPERAGERGLRAPLRRGVPERGTADGRGTAGAGRRRRVGRREASAPLRRAGPAGGAGQGAGGRTPTAPAGRTTLRAGRPDPAGGPLRAAPAPGRLRRLGAAGQPRSAGRDGARRPARGDRGRRGRAVRRPGRGRPATPHAVRGQAGRLEPAAWGRRGASGAGGRRRP